MAVNDGIQEDFSITCGSRNFHLLFRFSNDKLPKSRIFLNSWCNTSPHSTAMIQFSRLDFPCTAAQYTLIDEVMSGGFRMHQNEWKLLVSFPQ